jgi:hypothetical protein
LWRTTEGYGAEWKRSKKIDKKSRPKEGYNLRRNLKEGGGSLRKKY